MHGMSNEFGPGERTVIHQHRPPGILCNHGGGGLGRVVHPCMDRKACPVPAAGIDAALEELAVPCGGWHFALARFGIHDPAGPGNMSDYQHVFLPAFQACLSIFSSHEPPGIDLHGHVILVLLGRLDIWQSTSCRACLDGLLLPTLCNVVAQDGAGTSTVP